MDAPWIGGAERYFADLCDGLAARGLDVHAVSTEGGVLLPWLRERLTGGVSLHAVMARPVFDDSFVGNVVRGLRPFIDIRALLRGLHPDIVHLNNGGYPGSHVCRSAAFATSCPTVMTVHSVARPRRGGGRRTYVVLDRLVWRSLDRVICPVQASARSLRVERGAPADLLRVINCGTAMRAPAVEDVQRARARLAPNGELVVGMVVAPATDEGARFKGHDVLLEAIVGGPQAMRVAIVGHDPGNAYRERAASLGVDDKLIFLSGYRDTAPLMEAFDLLVVPSTRNEALPLVVLEAMAARTPVLASRLSGIPEAVIDRESGFTFEPGNVGALRALLNLGAEDRPLLARLGERAHALWRERFSLERMVSATVDVYMELLA